MRYYQRQNSMNQNQQANYAPDNDLEHNEVIECLNKIVTDWKKWESWHGESEKCSTMMDYRGPARFHQKMQERAMMDYRRNSKKFADKPFGIKTKVDMEDVSKFTETSHFYTEDEFVSHLDTWYNLLSESRILFSESAKFLANCNELTFYKMVCCYIEQIENEMWAVCVLKDRITPSQINHPDAYKVFCKLHVYFHDCYDYGLIDFDI